MIGNIEKAIQIEQLYCINSINNPSLSLLELLKDCNYSTLSDFQSDKVEYYTQKIKFNQINLMTAKQLEKNIPNIIKNQELILIKLEDNKINITHGYNDNTLIESKLQQYPEINLLKSPCAGGTIIIGPEDSFIFFTAKDISAKKLSKFFLKKFKTLLDEYFDDVTIQNNDILINNEKVIGIVSEDIKNHCSYFCFFASFQDRKELINNLISKNGKNPGYINSSILSKEVFEKEVLSWLV